MRYTQCHVTLIWPVTLIRLHGCSPLTLYFKYLHSSKVVPAADRRLGLLAVAALSHRLV